MRFRLILAVDGILFILALAFLVFDYQRELTSRIFEKKTALQEEAKTLLPGIIHLCEHSPDAIQTYIDDVCGRMEDRDSPSHHIAVDLDSQLIQAQAHHRASVDLVKAMKLASKTRTQQIDLDGRDLVVGTLSQGNISVFVSEDISKIRWRVLRDEMRRLSGILLLGLVGTAVINGMLVRMVTQPLETLVHKVREVGDGQFTTHLRSFGSAEFDFLADEINQMSEALDLAERARSIRLDKARRIQQNLLPRDPAIPAADVGTLYCPAEAVGGDYFDLLPLQDDGKWLVCMADATDHGVPAAMSAAMLKTLLLQTSDSLDSPARILAHMNRLFMQVNLYGDFATIVLLVVDRKRNRLTYANAGHDPVWLIQPDGVRELLATGTLLGIDEETVWEDQVLELSGRDRLAIATDGITETFNARNEMFGKQRLLDLLVAHRQATPQATAQAVLDAVVNYRGDQKQTDDLTMLLLDLTLSSDQNP